MVFGLWGHGRTTAAVSPTPGSRGGARPRASRRTPGASGSRAARERDRRALSRAGAEPRRSRARAATRRRRTPRRSRRRPPRTTRALKASSSAVMSYQPIRSPRPRATSARRRALRLPRRDVDEDVPHGPGGLGPRSPERGRGNAADECQGLGPQQVIRRMARRRQAASAAGLGRDVRRAAILARSYAALRPRISTTGNLCRAQRLHPTIRPHADTHGAGPRAPAARDAACRVGRGRRS